MAVGARIALLAVAATLTRGVPALADTPETGATAADVGEFPGASYFIDGGAVPLFWATGLTALSLHLFVDPPAKPRLFPDSEGGEPRHGDSIPEAWVGIYGGLAAVGVGLIPDESRWYHVKGIAETLATTLAITEIAKVTFGRHRPYWNETITDDDARQSFFSGHSSVSFATSTYLVLYLNGHVFSRVRHLGDRFAWWEAFPYLLLEGGAAAVAATRVHDNRHHVGDVITGSAVGVVTATALYLWQEHRFRDRRRGADSSIGLSPSLSHPRLFATWRW